MPEEPRTERGRRTRERIVAAAAGLVERQGVEATSLDQVLAEAGASKSQLYHYFADKQALVRAIIAWQTTAIVDAMAEHLVAIDSWAGLDAWFDALVAHQRALDCRIGCPIGSLAAELADTDEPARQDLARSFDAWAAQLRTVLDRLRDRGLIRPDADTATLAQSTLAAIQGGLLLAKTTRDPQRLRAALTAAGGYLRSLAPSP
ncbi:TetR/AcrR family transcriptional regulator [Planomonospora parontospora]|uniref:TetR/AcrR family transcriptional regulator n=1 Tax=Planomonospora parontospora TaxID=58119 RepID=UPI00166FD2F6|nr:TetR/AcrR family transcriptional regulator [Planomonospora parontospora]GGL30110.1 transcriptional regulator [Planomonospora parontospora subsp. antibiotica]GII17745.1 transcriptional regulator [Planomonospora parontospora subsp. antibiotica]